ncbi:ribosomal-processing cysteine protease Prp, partial [Vibrio cholerae]|uniref:ribosomal-processing cysteine protease Prp n=1 Tax=Vibrio cholerae TaxID=666 RepID=UPI00301C2B42
MIWVKVKTREDRICALEITGHAGFAESGKDIVCSAVSSIGTGLLNAIDIMCPEDCVLIKEDNLIKIEV